MICHEALIGGCQRVPLAVEAAAELEAAAVLEEEAAACLVETAAEIGVVTPYRGQCGKIRKLLKEVTEEVKIGSVEEFQGQERRIIIMSTVRSSPESVETDLKHTLGFVANPRRLNVAVTRAQAMLIIVGDPAVLSLDPLWRSFLNYIHLRGGWTGSPISWDPTAVVDAGGYDRAARDSVESEMSDFARRLEELTLAGMESVEEVGLDEASIPFREAE